MAKCRHKQACQDLTRNRLGFNWQPDCNKCQINQVEKLEDTHYQLPISYCPDYPVGLHRYIDDTQAAYDNRQRVAQDYCGDYYRHQSKITEGWELGTLPPAELRLGTINDVSRTVTRTMERGNEINQEGD